MDAIRLGRSVRALRIRARLRQTDAAALARVARSTIHEIEVGRLRRTMVGDLVDTVEALGADVDVRIRWRGEGLDRLLDEAHAGLVQAIVARLTFLGWECAIEVSFSIWGERGSVDLLGWHAQRLALLVCEVKSIVPDAQATISPLDRKTRLARRIAADRGWEPASVSRLLVIGDSTTSRRRVARFDALFRAAFPDRGASLRRWLRRPTATVSGLMFLPYASRRGVGPPPSARERVHRPRRASNGAE